LHHRNVISVNIYGVEASVFHQSKEQLLGMGYDLHFYPCCDHSTVSELRADICIVDIARLDECGSIFKQAATPYLISGITDSNEAGLPVEVLKNSVGFMNGCPTASDMGINLSLGLLWHEEREKYSQRVQDIDEKINNNRTNGVAIGMLMQQSGLLEQEVMTCLKSISRDKRRRMVDVSAGIIDNTYLLEKADLTTLAKLKNWLVLAIPNRSSTRDD